MEKISDNNKRVAKNTIMLYCRMFIMVLVTLYTSRVVLQTLGVEDYGIYNVVGGIVSMMGIVNSALVIATQRFIMYELGKGNQEQLGKIFSSSFICFSLLSVIIFILAETVGLWFLNAKMVIPADRLIAANWVYQFSILACLNTLLVNPYNACIIAHEKMDVYAYVSILEVVLKLIVVYLLLIIPYDRLIVYGALILFCQVLITMVYRIYCIKHFNECRVKFHKDMSLYKKMFSFTGWNLLGSLANLLQTQGLNILLNLFFSPAVNASRGIANQVNGTVSNFFNNFLTAVRPQIIKYYSIGDTEKLYKLINRSSRFSYYLILLVSMPIIIEAPFLLDLWLGIVPDYAVPFTRLIVVITAVDAISNPLMTLAQANGNIKMYSIVTGSILLTIVPISYVVLRLGGSPSSVFVVALFVAVSCLISRMLILKRMVNFDMLGFAKNALAPIVLVTIISSLLPLYMKIYFDNESFKMCIVISAICLFSTMISSFLLGMSKYERGKVLGMIHIDRILRKKK